MANPHGGGPLGGKRYGSPLGTVIAWLAIGILFVLWTLPVGSDGSNPNAPKEPSRLGAVEVMQGRTVLGFDALLKSLGRPEPQIVEAQAAQLRDGTPIQRIAYAILVHAVSGPAAARTSLDSLRDGINGAPLSAEDQALLAATEKRLEAAELKEPIPPLDKADAERLGWYGEVLEGRAAGSSGVVAVLFGAMIWYFGIGLVGVVVLALCIVFTMTGSLKLQCEPASALGSVLVETFAIWMTIFFGLQSIAIYLSTHIESLGSVRILVAPGIFVVSLLALAWPRVRGVPWSDTRAAIGLHGGKGFREVLWGAAGYSIALPFMGLGLIAVWILTTLFGGGEAPSHPAVEQLAESGILGTLYLFFLACICAPIVEEIFFRGVFYRYLRDVSGGESPNGFLSVLSILVSAIVSSAVFALVHPQGFLYAPLLAGLAVGFCMIREWRGSLVPGMIAHAITNCITLLLNVGLQG
ncbi:MAG: CPBP family intramembrane metalloprotease [Phycisphaerae bacterium]|nr:CPBP family intramembrane metalloprotease [Phycisphaerae bacterium]